MSCICNDNCKSLCGYEFDVLGLYINFKDKSLWDVRYAIDTWKQLSGVDIRNVTLCYNEISRSSCEKLGLFERLDRIKYLESLGSDIINFYTGVYNTLDDYIKMYNYISSHRSLCIFFGEMTQMFKDEFNEYRNCGKVPCITITPNKYCKVFWSGISDPGYEVLYSDDTEDYIHRRY